MRDFATHASPLTALLKDAPDKKKNKKGKPFKGFTTPEQHEAWDTLTRRLAEAPILAHPDFDKPFEVHCDASLTGIGVVLVQVHEGQERVVAYASRVLKEAELGYSIYELEMLALVWAVNIWRPYLLPAKFMVRTDNRALAWLRTQKAPTRLLRFTHRLQEFDFDIKHRSAFARGTRLPLATPPP